MVPIPKGTKLSEEHKRRIREACSRSRKHKEAFDKMMADPDRVKKSQKALKEIRRKKKQEKKAQEKRRLKATRAPLGRLIAVDGRDLPRYYALWVSPVEPDYTVKVATLKVIRYGRPRDPWGNFMKPVHPEHIFGLPLRNGDKLVYPPNKQTTLQNGVSEHRSGSDMDDQKQPSGADGTTNVGENPATLRRVYKRHRFGYT